MSISSTNRIAGPFIGAGTTATFPFTFKVFATSDVVVKQTDIATGVTTTKTLTTDYTVSLNANQDVSPGGSVTLVAGNLATGTSQIVTSNVPNLQPMVLTNAGGFFPTVLNDSADRSTIQIQQIASLVNNAIQAPVSDGPFPMVLPTAALRANKAIVFDSSGNVGVSVDNYVDQIATVAASAAAAAASAAAALTSQNAAATSATASTASATDSAAQAAKLTGTSTTSVAIALGTKAFTTQSGKLFNGENVRVYSLADVTNFMDGLATYTGTSLSVNVTSIGGSGTHTDWVIVINGAKGAQGDPGAVGVGMPIASAGGTVDAITVDYTPDITLADKQLVAFIASGANTSATPTFQPDGLTAHVMTKRGGAALVAGDIPGAGAIIIAEYNLTSTRWEIANPGTIAEANISFTDITSGDVSTTKHGFAPKAPNDATKFLNGMAAYAQVKESDIAFTDITTGNVSITKHGHAPKAPNDATKYLDGTGAYSIPGSVGSGRLINVQFFAASGTWTKPVGTNAIKIWVIGAGGGGAGAVSPGNGGDGGGSYDYITSGIGATETVTVGAGGAGGATASGSNGGTSSFGSHASATGGSGGISSGSTGGAGGSGSGGSINIQGTDGLSAGSARVVAGGRATGLGPFSLGYGTGGAGQNPTGANGTDGFVMVESYS